MVDLENIKGIYLYPEPVSYRMGIPALSNLILSLYEESEIIDCLFIFFGKDKSQIKIIEINDDGIWLYNKKLKEGTFIFPRVDDNITIDKKQLLAILKTIKIRHKKDKKNLRKMHKNEVNPKVWTKI